jgi:hypothetical protein
LGLHPLRNGRTEEKMLGKAAHNSAGKAKGNRRIAQAVELALAS